MKFGLLLNKKTENIGDDIQAYAAKRFLPQIDYIIDREELDVFALRNQVSEEVSVIMNGWYMYNKFNWPPSPAINPLLLSMHISPKDYLGIGDKFLDGIGGDYLKEHGPVGARDISTLNLLSEKGIPAYLSGCLTLTLEKKENVDITEDVLFVDINPEITAKIKNQFPGLNYKSSSNYVDYIHTEKSITERFSNVEKTLEEYQKARCVITSRLHCALPCLALEVPVILIYKDDYKDRMGSFLELLHVYTEKDILEKGMDFDLITPISNKKDYQVIRAKLKDTCTRFVEQAKKDTGKKKFDCDYSINKLLWQKSLLYDTWAHIQDTLEDAHGWCQTLENTKQYLEKQLETQKNWSEQLQTAKDYLENQLNDETKRNQELEQALSSQKAWSDELQNSKDYLENKLKEEIDHSGDLNQLLVTQKAWSEELQNTKNYLENKLKEEIEHSDELNQWLSTQKAWSVELQSAKDYLENKLKKELEHSNELNVIINTEKTWSADLQKAKDYLEDKLNNEIQHSMELEGYLSEQKSWSEQLQQGKDYLESLCSQQKEAITAGESKCNRYEEELADLKNELAKVQYKYNKLVTDSLIRKVIRIKKLEV